MEPTVYYSMTIFFLITTVNGASIISGINNVIYNKECRELLNNENQSQRPSYCTEAQGPIPEVLQKEIEGKMGEHLSTFAMPPQSSRSEPLSNDDCTSVDAQQNCCTKSGWESPTFFVFQEQLAVVVQSPHFIQQVKTVKCAQEGECFADLYVLKQMGYSTKCKTNYAYKKVFAYYIAKKEFTWVYISSPVSCSCVISRPSALDY